MPIRLSCGPSAYASAAIRSNMNVGKRSYNTTLQSTKTISKPQVFAVVEYRELTWTWTIDLSSCERLDGRRFFDWQDPRLE